MFSLQKTSYEWVTAHSVSYPSKGGCFGNWIVFEILMLHVEFIVMQDRNIEVCKDTALTRLLCFVDVLILRIPLHEICYLLLLGFFWIWYRHSMKAKFWPPRLPNFILAHLILQRYCLLLCKTNNAELSLLFFVFLEVKDLCRKRWNDWTWDRLCCVLLLLTLDWRQLHPSFCFWQCRDSSLPLSSHLSYIFGFVSCFLRKE